MYWTKHCFYLKKNSRHKFKDNVTKNYDEEEEAEKVFIWK